MNINYPSTKLYKDIKADKILSGRSHVKNILRIYEADIYTKVKNTEAEMKKTLLKKNKKNK